MIRHRALSSAARALLVALASGTSPWRHGYDLSKVIGVSSGTLYTLLPRLSRLRIGPDMMLLDRTARLLCRCVKAIVPRDQRD